MNRFLKALVPTVLLAELALITSATAVWAILSEMHAGKQLIFGAEVADLLGAVMLAVIIFRRAYAAEAKMMLAPADSEN